MKSKWCLTSLILLSWGLMVGQVEIEGWVRDADSGVPLVAATVMVDGKGTYTDLEGHFTVSLPVGTYNLELSYVGYQIVKREISVPLDGALEISMHPQSSMLDAVTISVGKYEQRLGETTVSIETLKPDLIEQSNTTSIDDVLDKLPGVQMIDGQVNIRGGSGFSYGAGSRVLLMVDDIPAYQPDAGFPNWDDYPIENLAQVEVVKGASSVLYGSSALNGTINMRTKYATDKPVTKLFTSYRAYFNPRDLEKKWWDKAPGEFAAGISDVLRLGRFELANSLYYLDRKSVQRETYNHYGRINSKIRYRVSDDLEAGLGVNYNRGQAQSFFFWQDDHEGAYQGDSANYNTSDYTRFFIDPYLKLINDSGNRHELKGRISHIHNENNDNRSNTSTLYYGEYQYHHRLEQWDGVLTGGVVGIHTNISAELYGDTAFTSDNLAAYMQLEKKFFEKMNLVAGIRYESNVIKGPHEVDGQRIEGGKTKEAKPVVRFGLNYELSPYTFLRASWGQGYRFPTVAEKYIRTEFGGTFVSPNLSLQSETGWSAEVGIKQGFQISEFQGMLDVAAYWSEYFDMMEFVFTGLIDGFQSQNIGDTRISGIDVSISGEGKIGDINNRLVAGYTYIDPVYQDFTTRIELSSSVDYNILKFRSKHQFKVDLQSDLKLFSAGVSFQYVSNIEAIDAIFQVVVPGLKDFRETHKGYAVTDLRLIYRLSQGIRFTGLLRNVFNAEYSIRPGLLADPQNFALRCDVQL